MWQDPVQRVLERCKTRVQLAFRDCATAPAEGGAAPPRPAGSACERTTTLREFEEWLGARGTIRAGAAAAGRGRSGFGKRTVRKIFALVQQLDWADGSISDDTEMSLDEFREALVALTLYINPSPFRAIDQRVEEGLELLLADTNR